MIHKLVFLCTGLLLAQPAANSLSVELSAHSYDLGAAGRTFLLDEARKASFFLLGELHGEKEIPELLRALWPEMRKAGYAHIAAELSPWAATELEFGTGSRPLSQATLWSREDARFVHGQNPQAVIWGCDMEEGQPDELIRAFAAINPGSRILAEMVSAIKPGYSRSAAPRLLSLAESLGPLRDRTINGVSLRANLIATLRIENYRLNPETRYQASVERENLMKSLFNAHAAAPSQKIFARFGRNHLHRGYDARGISTLGNFIAELAVARHAGSFHVAAFAAGGQGRLAGETFDADERGDEAAFRLLASLAPYPATVFDLRPIRAILHLIPGPQRTELDQNLLYWADSYDAIICYQKITPLD